MKYQIYSHTHYIMYVSKINQVESIYLEHETLTAENVLRKYCAYLS